jgi:hypothetical protein
MSFIYYTVIYPACIFFLINLILTQINILYSMFYKKSLLRVYEKDNDNYINPLFRFLDKIVETVQFLVYQYFITFRYCWYYILYALIKMIDRYIDFLQYMVGKLTSYPFCIYGSICVLICMVCACYIIKVISGDL